MQEGDLLWENDKFLLCLVVLFWFLQEDLFKLFFSLREVTGR